ncbi:hypothetical protein COOONC_03919 [Cooperia oncophora]
MLPVDLPSFKKMLPFDKVLANHPGPFSCSYQAEPTPVTKRMEKEDIQDMKDLCTHLMSMTSSKMTRKWSKWCE